MLFSRDNERSQAVSTNLVVFAVSEYSPTYLHLLTSHKRESRFRIPKFRFRILKIQESFACEIWNPGLWNPECSSRNLDPNPSYNDKESRIQYLEAGIHGLESRRRRQKTGVRCFDKGPPFVILSNVLILSSFRLSSCKSSDFS